MSRKCDHERTRADSVRTEAGLAPRLQSVRPRRKGGGRRLLGGRGDRPRPPQPYFGVMRASASWGEDGRLGARNSGLA